MTFNYGKLTGWAISLYCSELITCTKFYENHIDEAKLTFDCTEELWIASRYDDKGRVEQILHVENGKPSMLPSLMTSV